MSAKHFKSLIEFPKNPFSVCQNGQTANSHLQEVEGLRAVLQWASTDEARSATYPTLTYLRDLSRPHGCRFFMSIDVLFRPFLKPFMHLAEVLGALAA